MGWRGHCSVSGCSANWKHFFTLQSPREGYTSTGIHAQPTRILTKDNHKQDSQLLSKHKCDADRCQANSDHSTNTEGHFSSTGCHQLLASRSEQSIELTFTVRSITCLIARPLCIGLRSTVLCFSLFSGDRL